MTPRRFTIFRHGLVKVFCSRREDLLPTPRHRAVAVDPFRATEDSRAPRNSSSTAALSYRATSLPVLRRPARAPTPVSSSAAGNVPPSFRRTSRLEALSRLLAGGRSSACLGADLRVCSLYDAALLTEPIARPHPKTGTGVQSTVHVVSFRSRGRFGLTHPRPPPPSSSHAPSKVTRDVLGLQSEMARRRRPPLMIDRSSHLETRGVRNSANGQPSSPSPAPPPSDPRNTSQTKNEHKQRRPATLARCVTPPTDSNAHP